MSWMSEAVSQHEWIFPSLSCFAQVTTTSTINIFPQSELLQQYMNIDIIIILSL